MAHHHLLEHRNRTIAQGAASDYCNPRPGGKGGARGSKMTCTVATSNKPTLVRVQRAEACVA